MNIHDIVEALKQELGRLDNAIAALEGSGSQSARRGPGRPPKSTSKRHMSAAARKRISEAMKARWAKKKGKAAPKKTTSKRKPMSPAMRKKLSAMMKARWAERKKAA
jgi:hypothetical protein